MRKLLSIFCIGALLLTGIPYGYAAETQVDYTTGTEVTYVGQSDESYTITVPAKLNPGASGTVSVDGYWSSSRVVKVTADKTVTLTNSINNADKKVLDITFAGISKTGNNTAATHVEEIVSVANINNALFGSWSGTFYYNASIEAQKAEIQVTATDTNGNNLNAQSYVISGDEKNALLESLKNTDLIDDNTEVDALIEVKSDEFEDIADTTFDVSSIAQPGDKVVILHFDETKQTWEFVSEETVDDQGKVNADFTSYSPVAFVVIKPDGTIVPIVPGTNTASLYLNQPYNSFVIMDDTSRLLSLVFYEDGQVDVFLETLCMGVATYSVEDDGTVLVTEGSDEPTVGVLSADGTVLTATIYGVEYDFIFNNTAHDLYKNKMYSVGVATAETSFEIQDDGSYRLWEAYQPTAEIPAAAIPILNDKMILDIIQEEMFGYISKDGTQVVIPHQGILMLEKEVVKYGIQYSIVEEGDICIIFKPDGEWGWRRQYDLNDFALGPMNTYIEGRTVFFVNDAGEETRMAVGRFSADGTVFYSYNFLNEENPLELICTFMCD